MGLLRANDETKGPDALDWQNLFGLSKIPDKICLCHIINLQKRGRTETQQNIC